MKSEICRDKTYMVKEGEILQMISDLQPEPSGQVDVWEEEEDLLAEEDEDHQEDHQTDRQEDHREEIIITEIGMTSKVTTKAVT